MKYQFILISSCLFLCGGSEGIASVYEYTKDGEVITREVSDYRSKKEVTRTANDNQVFSKNSLYNKYIKDASLDLELDTDLAKLDDAEGYL